MNERIQELAKEAIEIVAKKRILPDGQVERTWQPEYYDQVFADLIRADEREACAKLADAASMYNRFISIEIASAIRARNNQ